MNNKCTYIHVYLFIWIHVYIHNMFLYVYIYVYMVTGWQLAPHTCAKIVGILNTEVLQVTFVKYTWCVATSLNWETSFGELKNPFDWVDVLDMRRPPKNVAGSTVGEETSGGFSLENPSKMRKKQWITAGVLDFQPAKFWELWCDGGYIPISI